MKRLPLIAVYFLLSISIAGQTLIATTNHTYATANHNQRKIVRDSADNVLVIYVDYINQESQIKGLVLDRATQQWGIPFLIIAGTNPTLAISSDDQIYLLYQSNGSNPEIRLVKSTDFQNWSEPLLISETGSKSYVPIADVDSAGNLNTFWKQINPDLTSSLIYARILGGQVAERKIVFTKAEINDYAIANHLMYMSNRLFFALQWAGDSTGFYYSDDRLQSYIAVFLTEGHQPCITYNSRDDNNPTFVESARFLFLDFYKINEAESYGSSHCSRTILPFVFSETICVDDLSPPIGYSFLSALGSELVHAFSYGCYWNSPVQIMETIDAAQQVSHPTIAYKHYNFEFVDFIWMQGENSPYEIYYMRDSKHYWTGLEDPDPEKGFTITGSPNPFAESVTFNLKMETINATPVLEVYDVNSRLISTLSVEQINDREYKATWNGTNQNGETAASGIYVVLCTASKSRAARKVLFQP